MTDARNPRLLPRFSVAGDRCGTMLETPWGEFVGYEHVQELEAEYTVLLARVARLEEDRQWQPIATAPKDGTLILGALIRNGKVWRVHDMQHNGLAFYTINGGSLPQMTHWLPPAPPVGTRGEPERKP